ncbi:MAG: Mur ligase family protein, partial [Verrucomicrobiaceae bacterium]
MKPQTIQTLIDWCQGRLLQGEPEMLVHGVTTDTRTAGPQSLFVALSGENFDAHDFLGAAAEKGSVAFLIARELPHYPKGAVILVRDTLVALQSLARAWRKAWGGKVLGLTGSNGKTSTKDLVSSVLSQEFIVSATKGNLNNHIGLPLTILSTSAEDQ